MGLPPARPPRRPAVLLPAAVLALAAVLASSLPAAAGSGAGEVLLDRGAVASLVAANFPAGRKVAIPPLGEVTIRFVPPETVNFVDGTVEARIGVRVVEAGLGGSALCRFAPEVLEGGSLVRLRVVRAQPDGALSMLPNLAALIPPIDVQAGYNWVAPDRKGGQTAFGLTIQGIQVRQDRLEIRLGLTTATAARKAQRPRAPSGQQRPAR